MLKTSPCATISLSAIKNNYFYVKNLAEKGVVCSAVVKANSYGLGATKIASMLYNDADCRDFWVAYIEEAIELREMGIPKNANIYYLQGFLKSHIKAIRHYSLTPVINTNEEFECVKNNCIEIVLHVDTGITRLGIRDITPILKNIEKENIKYIISHLACADEPGGHLMNTKQKEEFDNILRKIKKNNIKAGISASAGFLLLPRQDYSYNIIRPGAFLYGIHFGDHFSQNVLTLTAKVIQRYKVPNGTSVGYGATHVTVKKDSELAVISIGYSDGIRKNLGNSRGKVMFYDSKGTQYSAAIIGAISMDMIVCDVSNIPMWITRVYNDAYILDSKYTINEMAKDAGMTPYEILTSINLLSKRFSVKYI
ncbi:MAG: alanine racemase [Holosporales bacterium]|jgi:alanine racemase|nr:alanine racemase [Holosporales bacterium]